MRCYLSKAIILTKIQRMSFVITTYIYLAILLLSSLSSLVVHFQPNIPSYLKWFSPFLLLTFLVEVFANRIYVEVGNNSLLYNLFTIFEFVFYFIVLKKIIRSRIIRKIVVYILMSYPVLALLNTFFWQGQYKFHSYTFIPGALVVVGLCAYHFHELLKLPDSPDLKREHSFWVVCALLFYYGGTLPLWAANTLMHEFPKNVLKLMGIVIIILNYVLYSLFTVAFLCNIKPRNHYR